MKKILLKFFRINSKANLSTIHVYINKADINMDISIESDQYRPKGFSFCLLTEVLS